MDGGVERDRGEDPGAPAAGGNIPIGSRCATGACASTRCYSSASSLASGVLVLLSATRSVGRRGGGVYGEWTPAMETEAKAEEYRWLEAWETILSVYAATARVRTRCDSSSCSLASGHLVPRNTNGRGGSRWN